MMIEEETQHMQLAAASSQSTMVGLQRRRTLVKTSLLNCLDLQGHHSQHSGCGASFPVELVVQCNAQCEELPVDFKLLSFNDVSP